MTLSTLEGQRQHYRPIRDRLFNGETPPEKPRRIIHLPGSAPAEILPVASKRRIGLAKGPKVRDFLRLEADVVHPLPSPMVWRSIVSEVCHKHDVTYLELCSARRKVHLVAARAEAAYRLYHETTLSTPQIGRKLGGRDHSTIVHAIRRHAAARVGEVYRIPRHRKKAGGT